MQNILFLSHRVPCPPDKGDRIRSYHILRYLSARANVHLGFLTDDTVPEATLRELQSLCERVFVGRIPKWRRWHQAGMSWLAGRSITEAWFHSSDFQTQVDRLLNTFRYDAVMCYSSSTLQYMKPGDADDRLIVDLIDVDSQKWFDYADHASPLMARVFRSEGAHVRQIEQRAGSSRAVTLTTSREAALYREYNPKAPIHVVKNGIDLDFYSPRNVVERLACIFVGYLDYRANVIGLQWFCQHVWPELVKNHPGAKFSIVGRNPIRAIRRLENIPGVEVVGPVDDVRPLIAETSVVVVPLPVARGVQNKILEAMSMGKVVVASRASLAGIDACRGSEVIEADSPEEWVSHIRSLWMEVGKRQEIGFSARRFVEAHHHWQQCLAPIGTICGLNKVSMVDDEQVNDQLACLVRASD